MSFRAKMTLKGEKNGDIGEFEILSFNYSVKSPRDVASGMATGKRQHSAMEIKMLMTGPALRALQAVYVNEKLKDCEIVFDKSDLQSGFQNLKIASGAVTYFEQTFDSISNEPFVVTIHIIAYEVEFSSSDGGHSANDSWLTPV